MAARGAADRMTMPDTRRTIDAVWRMESAKIVAALTRMVRDVGIAEEIAQDALVTALERWPQAGIPEKPGAWLMATARNRAIDILRRDKRLEQKHEELGRAQEREDAMRGSGGTDGDFGDDILRLMFITCHPVLATEARVALTLRLLGGLTTPEIARAFLVPEPTVAQRIVRAKRTLSEARVPFEAPQGRELAARLASVMEVIYLVFNEGYSATAGDDWVRPGLCEDAMRLGRIVAELSPREPEVHGLVALMEIRGVADARAGRTVRGAASCSSTRTGRGGTRSSSTAGSPRWSGPSLSAARWDPTACRRPSRPATRGRARPPRRTGCASRRSTTPCRRSPRRRWSS